MTSIPRPRPFIPAALDDLGLDPHEFRVLCHVWRRAGADRSCFESVENIAATCGMKKRRAQYALRFLTKAGLIRICKPGGGRSRTTVYETVPTDEWPSPETVHVMHPLEKVHGSAETVHEAAGNGARTKRETVHVMHPKVLPLKVLQRRESQLEGVQADACDESVRIENNFNDTFTEALRGSSPWTEGVEKRLPALLGRSLTPQERQEVERRREAYLKRNRERERARRARLADQWRARLRD